MLRAIYVVFALFLKYGYGISHFLFRALQFKYYSLRQQMHTHVLQ